MADTVKRGRGRSKGFVMPEEHRTKISNAKIFNRLIDHVNGKEGVDLSATQVAAALGLLKKVMPDLSAITMDAEVKHDLSDDMKTLMNMASKKTKRVGEK